MIKNIGEIVIAGQNVTGDVSADLSRISYTDNIEAVSDDVTLTFVDKDALWQKPWYPRQGDTLRIRIGKPGDLIDCGLFEIDEIGFSGPPDTVNIKAIGAAITKELRTRNSKAFEKQSLRNIARFFADKHGLTLTGNTSDLQDIEIERKTQEDQTDIAFLAGLAAEFGIIFSIRGTQLIFIDMATMEEQPAVMTIDKSDMGTFDFTDKTSQIYSAASVATRDIRSNSVQRYTAVDPGEEGVRETLVVNRRVENETQARAVAEGSLKNRNKDKITGRFGVVGNVKLVAGINVELTGLGEFSGKWQVVSSAHTVDVGAGYVTDVSVRKILQA